MNSLNGFLWTKLTKAEIFYSGIIFGALIQGDHLNTVLGVYGCYLNSTCYIPCAFRNYRYLAFTFLSIHLINC